MQLQSELHVRTGSDRLGENVGRDVTAGLRTGRQQSRYGPGADGRHAQAEPAPSRGPRYSFRHRELALVGADASLFLKPRIFLTRVNVELSEVEQKRRGKHA